MEIIFLRQAHHFIRKADKPLRQRIKAEILRIKQNPFLSDKLHGKLKHIYSHHFSFKGTHYRIAYKVVDNIIVIMISSRENFYRDLSR